MAVMGILRVEQGLETNLMLQIEKSETKRFLLVGCAVRHLRAIFNFRRFSVSDCAIFGKWKGSQRTIDGNEVSSKCHYSQNVNTEALNVVWKANRNKYLFLIGIWRFQQNILKEEPFNKNVQCTAGILFSIPIDIIQTHFTRTCSKVNLFCSIYFVSQFQRNNFDA